MERFRSATSAGLPRRSPLARTYKDWLALVTTAAWSIWRALPLKEDSTQWAPRAPRAIVSPKTIFLIPIRIREVTFLTDRSLPPRAKTIISNFVVSLKQLAGAFKWILLRKNSYVSRIQRRFLERALPRGGLAGSVKIPA